MKQCPSQTLPCVMAVLLFVTACLSRELQILWLMPRADQDDYKLASSMGPFALALENTRTEGLLHGYDVNITWLDSACDPKAATGLFVAFLLKKRPDAIFGPPCTKAMVPVADLASYMNIPIYSWVSNMHDLDNKTVKTTLMRTVAPLSSLGDLLIFFCEKMGWSRVSMISTDGEKSEGMASFFKQTIENNLHFYLTREFSGVKDNANTSQIERMYRTIKMEARIIILVIPKAEVRRYLVIAHELGMTNGDYQFLYTERTVADKAFLDSLISTKFWKRGDEDDEKARRGYHNLLYFTYHYVTEWSLDTNESMEAALRVFGSYPSMPEPAPPDKFSRFLYDAFYLYSIAFNETIHKNLTPNGENIFDASKNKFFIGQTGRFLTNDQADRQSSFLVWDMNEEDKFRQVIVTRYNRKGLTWDVMAPILWGNGRMYNTSDGIYIPPDVPACGFLDEFCNDENLAEKIVSPIVVIIMLAGFIAFLVIYRWWKKEKALYETLWKIKYSDLNFNIARGHASMAGMSVMTGSHQSLNVLDNQSESSAGNMSSNCSSFRHDNMVMISQMFATVATLNGAQVAVKKVNKKTIKEDKALLKEMQVIMSLKHANLAIFFGACTEAPNICVLWEYCSKGSLEDILHNTDIKLDSMFQFSIALDICTGLNYLHDSELGLHGRLKTTNCVVDSRWVAKLTDFGLKRFRKGEKPLEEVSEEKYYTDLFWTAPEILTCILNNEKVVLTKEADIYSLGIVLKQILCKNLAYNEELITMTPKEIMTKVSNPEGENYMRPHINEEFPDHHIVMMSFVHLIKGCWAQDPTVRPSIRRVVKKMKRMSPLKTSGVLDNMLVLMERYSTRLEDLVSERTLQLEEEKRKTDTLLYRMLPKKVADDLKLGQHVQAEAFPDVTIYFSDIVGFTTLASESTPMEIVEMLNMLYSQFDDIIQNFNVYKVETIGDAYMVVCGCPDPNQDHAVVMADMALALLDSVIHFVIPHRPEYELRIRIGLNTGPVVAGVVGNTMPRYCLFGNAVNLASRMESQGMPQRIQISFFTYEVLKNNPDFIIENRGLVEIKGKGKMPTYWLNGRISSSTDHDETESNHTISSQYGNTSMDVTSPSKDTKPQKAAPGSSNSSVSNLNSFGLTNNLTSLTDIEEVKNVRDMPKPVSGETNKGSNMKKYVINSVDEPKTFSELDQIPSFQTGHHLWNHSEVSENKENSDSQVEGHSVRMGQFDANNSTKNIDHEEFSQKSGKQRPGDEIKSESSRNMYTLIHTPTQNCISSSSISDGHVSKDQRNTAMHSPVVASKENSPSHSRNASSISINTGDGPCQINLSITPVMQTPDLHRSSTIPSEAGNSNAHISNIPGGTLTTPASVINGTVVGKNENDLIIDFEHNVSIPTQKSIMGNQNEHENIFPGENTIMKNSSPSKELNGGPAKLFSHVYKNKSAKLSPKPDGLNGMNILDPGPTETQRNSPVIDETDLVPLQHDRSTKSSPNFQNSPKYLLSKRHSEKSVVHPAGRRHLIKASSPNEKGSSNSKVKTFEVHFENPHHEKTKKNTENRHRFSINSNQMANSMLDKVLPLTDHSPQAEQEDQI